MCYYDVFRIPKECKLSLFIFVSQQERSKCRFTPILSVAMPGNTFAVYYPTPLSFVIIHNLVGYARRGKMVIVPTSPLLVLEDVGAADEEVL